MPEGKIIHPGIRFNIYFYISAFGFFFSFSINLKTTPLKMLRNVARIARPVLTRGVLPAVC